MAGTGDVSDHPSGPWTGDSIYHCRRCGHRALTIPIIGSAPQCRQGHDIEVTPILPASIAREALRALRAIVRTAEEWEPRLTPTDIHVARQVLTRHSHLLGGGEC